MWYRRYLVFKLYLMKNFNMDLGLGILTPQSLKPSVELQLVQLVVSYYNKILRAMMLVSPTGAHL